MVVPVVLVCLWQHNWNSLVSRLEFGNAFSAGPKDCIVNRVLNQTEMWFCIVFLHIQSLSTLLLHNPIVSCIFRGQISQGAPHSSHWPLVASHHHHLVWLAFLLHHLQVEHLLHHPLPPVDHHLHQACLALVLLLPLEDFWAPRLRKRTSLSRPIHSSLSTGPNSVKWVHKVYC